MSFSTFVTDKSGLQKFYETIIGKYETYAPVEKLGNMILNGFQIFRNVIRIRLLKKP